MCSSDLSIDSETATPTAAYCSLLNVIPINPLHFLRFLWIESHAYRPWTTSRAGFKTLSMVGCKGVPLTCRTESASPAEVTFVEAVIDEVSVAKTPTLPIADRKILNALRLMIDLAVVSCEHSQVHLFGGCESGDVRHHFLRSKNCPVTLMPVESNSPSVPRRTYRLRGCECNARPFAWTRLAAPGGAMFRARSRP